MRLPLSLACALLSAPHLLAAQAGKFPPDSLINVTVIPKTTPVQQVIGTMRNFAGALGVRCSYCHVGEEGKPLTTYDFAKDDKRGKLVARQMMRMVEEINHRLDTLPERPAAAVTVTCATCHRGVSRPIPLPQLLAETAEASGLDSAVKAYRALRTRYYGTDAYNFAEMALNSAALRLGRSNHFAEAAGLLALNEEFYPNAPSTAVARGNVLLLQADTTGARAAFQDALKRNPNDREAQGRLRDIGG